MPVAQDDLHAQSWNTIFGSKPLIIHKYSRTQITSQSNCLKTTTTLSDLSKTSVGAQWNRPLNQEKTLKITNLIESIMMMSIPKKLKKIQIEQQIILPKNRLIQILKKELQKKLFLTFFSCLLFALRRAESICRSINPIQINTRNLLS